jgi:hypothetical protein
VGIASLKLIAVEESKLHVPIRDYKSEHRKQTHSVASHPIRPTTVPNSSSQKPQKFFKNRNVKVFEQKLLPLDSSEASDTEQWVTTHQPKLPSVELTNYLRPSRTTYHTPYRTPY